MALNGERIVVLGGSSGIGLATAQAAAREGATVVIASSRKARIDQALATLPPARKVTYSTWQTGTLRKRCLRGSAVSIIWSSLRARHWNSAAYQKQTWTRHSVSSRCVIGAPTAMPN